ncbi:cytochrome P450 [Streptosporangium soli]|nr:cytochrome P450 [Streptosporangium sp. KLBMP 9127]
MSIGEIYDPLGIHLLDPYPMYDRARDEEPLFYSPAVGAWVATRYDDLVQVLRDPETFSSAHPFADAVPLSEAAVRELQRGYPQYPDLIQSDGEVHSRLRAPIAQVLKADRVALLDPYIEEQAAELIDGFAADGEVEFMERYAVPLPCRTIGRLCGFDAEQSREAYSSLIAFTVLQAAYLTPDEEIEAARAGVRLQRLLGGMVRERHAHPRSDAISEVVALSTDGSARLSPEDEGRIVANLVQLVIAGHITTVPLMGMAMVLLLTHREQWERLCATPALIPRAVEEILRYGTPASGLYRETTRETKLGGVDLPSGARVALRYTAANRDPARFDRAAEFDVAREPTRHLSFGRGVHYCVGAGLARRQLEITLETLTTRLPGLRLAEPVTYRPVLDLRHPEAVRLAW